MGKLIDGDKLISTLVWGHYGIGKELQTVQKAIDDMRGEDAVPVIRCKDCEHWNGDDSETFCSELGIFGTGQNSFCSYARKKEEPTMEEFMYGQDLGDPEDGSL